MPRNYNKKVGGRTYSQYTSETVADAVEAVRTRQFSIREASQQYNIPVGTLYNKLHNLHLNQPGGSTVLTISQETDLCETIRIAGEWGYPLTPTAIKNLVKEYLDHNKVTSKFVNNTPGQDWLSSFLKRNKSTLASRWSQNIKRNRAKISHEIITTYFDNLEVTLDDVPPDNIINYDETNFTDDPESKKVVVRRGQKHVENVLDHSKTSYSVMFAGSATGKILPAYVVYAALHLYPTWTLGGPKGCRYNRTKSGKNLLFVALLLVFRELFFRMVRRRCV